MAVTSQDQKIWDQQYSCLLYTSEAYKDEKGWAKMAMLNTAHSGKFSSDRTIEEYVRDIWHLEKLTVEPEKED